MRATNSGGDSSNSNVVSASTTPNSGPENGLAATYFNNANLTGSTVARTDPKIDFNWKTGSPASGIGGDSFSVRWLGQVQAMETGAYRFRTHSDEGVKLWVNGKLLINNWTAHAFRVDTSVAITLTAGTKYDIKMQHYDNTGAAVAKLLWRRPGQSAYGIVPQTQLFVPGDGLAAAYFDSSNLSGSSVSRVDSTVNFNWGAGSPAAGLAPDTFRRGGRARFRQLNRGRTPSEPTATTAFGCGLTARRSSAIGPITVRSMIPERLLFRRANGTTLSSSTTTTAATQSCSSNGSDPGRASSRSSRSRDSSAPPRKSAGVIGPV